MQEKVDQNLVVIVFIMSIALFGAYKWKAQQAEQFLQQPPPSWDNWQPKNIEPDVQPPVMPPVTPPRTPVNPRSYEEAVQIAKSQNRDIFLYFGGDSCHWCRKMRDETLSVSGDVLSGYIVYNPDSNNERAVFKKYGISSIPSYFVIDGNETIKKRSQGFKSKTEFTAWLQTGTVSNPIQ